MSGATEILAGDWVGTLDISGSQLFVMAAWRDGDRLSGFLDMPGELTFRQPLVNVHRNADRLRFEVAAPNRALLFDGRVADGHFEGVVHRGRQSGSFHLSRVMRPAEATDASYVGTYAIGTGEIVLLAMRGDASDKFPFYARGDRLVPLYPTSPADLLSELGEVLSLSRDHDGSVTGIRWRRQDGVDLLAPSVSLYHEEDVQFHNGGVTLAGTLLTPFGPGPHPAVVIMHGSMPSERDFYRVYADHFARHGIATLIYDKRGSGASTGAVDATIADRAGDALGGLHLLQARPAIDARRVGLWGFSNSTWSLPMAASRSQDVAFLIATGASGVSMARSETHRRVSELREWGILPDTLAAVERAWEILFDYAVTGRWDDGWDEEWTGLVETLGRDEALARVPIQDYARANPRLSPIPTRIAAKELKTSHGWSAPDMGHDPAADYERVRCPVLFIVGERDGNLPARESAAAVAAALRRAGNRDYRVEVVPGAEHSLNLSYPGLKGIVAEEAARRLHGFRFAPGYLALMTNWILEHAAVVE